MSTRPITRRASGGGVGGRSMIGGDVHVSKPIEELCCIGRLIAQRRSATISTIIHDWTRDVHDEKTRGNRHVQHRNCLRRIRHSRFAIPYIDCAGLTRSGRWSGRNSALRRRLAVQLSPRLQPGYGYKLVSISMCSLEDRFSSLSASQSMTAHVHVG